MKTILVFGATGNVGAHVVSKLSAHSAQGAHGPTVRAFVRDQAAAAARLGDSGIEIVTGDLDDPTTIRRALAGVDRVFLTAADGPDKVAHENAVIDAAAAAGAELVVKLSALHADPASPLPAFRWHGEIEQHLDKSAVGAVVLQPSFYMSNLLMVAAGVAHSNSLFAPTGGGAVGMIDIRDVAAVAAAVLVDDRRADHTATRTLQLTGPTAVTFHDVAAALSQVVGRTIEYVDLTADEARPRFEGAGLPTWMQQHLAGVFDLIRAGAFATTTDTVRQVTGGPATTISDFFRDHAHAFAN